MRHFSHLSHDDIRTIIKSVILLNEPKTHVAKRLNIDHSTVIYHVKKYEGLPRERVVALITPKCEACSCTSMQCKQCGKFADNIKSDEYQEIYRLRQQVKDLTFKLKQYEKNHISTTSIPIIVGVVG